MPEQDFLSNLAAAVQGYNDSIDNDKDKESKDDEGEKGENIIDKQVNDPENNTFEPPKHRRFGSSSSLRKSFIARPAEIISNTINNATSKPDKPVIMNRKSTLLKHIDLSTGRVTQRRQTVQKIVGDDCEPKNNWDKMRSIMVLVSTIKWLKRATAVDEKEHDFEKKAAQAEKELADQVSSVQYRIRSIVYSDDFTTKFETYRFARLITEYLNWTFKATFFEVFLTSYFCFLFLIVIFGFGIWLVGQYQPQCMLVGSSDFETAQQVFMNAFHLSWTTFSTVGYGVLAPRVSTNPPTERCMTINMLMAFESYIGVLFGGVFGAIIFSKVTRIHSVAQVRFSFPINVRYGMAVLPLSEHNNPSAPPITAEKSKHDEKEGANPDGVREDNTAEKEKDEEKKDDNEQENNNNNGSNQKKDEQKDSEHCNKDANKKEFKLAKMNSHKRSASKRFLHPPPDHFPCPIIEFRLINELAHSKGGEIMNASVNVVASTLASVEESEVASIKGVRQRRQRERQQKAKRKQIPQKMLGTAKNATLATGNVWQRIQYKIAHGVFHHHESDDESTPFNSERSTADMSHLSLNSSTNQDWFGNKQKSGHVDEGDSKLVPPRIFHKLVIETDSHPFFKRVWNIRHHLNQHSPLLSRKARRLITHHGGYWPPSLNNHKSVREHIRFHEIIVSFSGTANASGSSVFAQKVYMYEDLCVGYTFANVLSLSEDGVLTVNQNVLNDVHEQVGGGGEPLSHVGLEIDADRFHHLDHADKEKIKQDCTDPENHPDRDEFCMEAKEVNNTDNNNNNNNDDDDNAPEELGNKGHKQHKHRVHKSSVSFSELPDIIENPEVPDSSNSISISSGKAFMCNDMNNELQAIKDKEIEADQEDDTDDEIELELSSEDLDKQDETAVGNIFSLDTDADLSMFDEEEKAAIQTIKSAIHRRGDSIVLSGDNI